MSVCGAHGEAGGSPGTARARGYPRRIRGAVEAYRRDRSPRNLLAAAGASLAATVVLAGAILVLIRFWRRLNLILESRYTRRLRSLEIQSVQVIHAERLREAVRTALRVVRALVIIGFAAVIAYPYIPGSESAAFKGMSIFFGVLFSLGASSVVANMMAGYSLIYRRTFKVGDRVKINDVVGDVVAMRLQVTHLRTIKNEDVIVPNSVILTSQVVNYSTYAAREGLILHTTVGIGYEVPWRQVEAMLLLAASRTPDLQAVPSPLVLPTSLGDFAVNYEPKPYFRDSHSMAARYTALHRNIQDVFNEYGVQIMTPAYESDPASPKVVPPDQWYQEPARSLQESRRKAAS